MGTGWWGEEITINGSRFLPFMVSLAREKNPDIDFVDDVVLLHVVGNSALAENTLQALKRLYVGKMHAEWLERKQEEASMTAP